MACDDTRQFFSLEQEGCQSVKSTDLPNVANGQLAVMELEEASALWHVLQRAATYTDGAGCS
jgi:hypothetical protein